MRVKLLKRFSIFFFALSLSALAAGCAAGANSGQPGALASNSNRLEGGPQTGGREVSIGESFKIGKDERVSVKETKLTVELKGTRESWYANGKGGFGEADVLVALDGKERRQWMKLGDEIRSGEYVVELSSVDPFGKTSAGLMVTRR